MFSYKRHVPQQLDIIIKYIYEKYLKFTYNLKFNMVWINQTTMKALYNIYIVTDVYYCNKYKIIVYMHIIPCRILYRLIVSANIRLK